MSWMLFPYTRSGNDRLRHKQTNREIILRPLLTPQYAKPNRSRRSPKGPALAANHVAQPRMWS